MDIRTALNGQYHAAMAMQRQTIEKCPDAMWLGGDEPVPFWQVVYHTLYFTHLYLGQTEAAFRPWALHREPYHDLPWPPGSGSAIADPYSKAELLDYWQQVDAMIDGAVDSLDLDAPESGFPWHTMIPKLEHQLHNVRHIQHHTAILAARLRRALGDAGDVEWVRTG